MNTPERRYDIDWLRVIAIGLLLIYHVAIVFQPWAPLIGFPMNEEPLDAIWPLMALLNVWRIPLLFFVSGMGVCFAIRRRNWRQLMLERTRRILLPFVFGSLVIVPLQVFVLQRFYQQDLRYLPHPWHLWFLGHIFVYVLVLSPLFFFVKRRPDNPLFNALRRWLALPAGIYLFALPFVLEAAIIRPEIFSLYVGTTHGFLLGLLAFLFGFLFVALGGVFWHAVDATRVVSLAVALGLYLLRWSVFRLEAPPFLTAIESLTWIYAVLGFGYRHLNHPSRVLGYLSEAAYPIYIVHLLFLYSAAYIFLPLGMPVISKLLVIVLLTFAGCFASYELLIRRTPLFRPLFGLKPEARRGALRYSVQNEGAGGTPARR